MLKNRLLSGVAAIAMFAAASGATPAAARETFDWTGVYIGGHVGGGVADYDGGKDLVEASPIFVDDLDLDGFAGGGHVGVNDRFGSPLGEGRDFVAGIEGDATFTDWNATLLADLGDSTEAISGDVDVLASVRAGLGVMYERGYDVPRDYDEAVKWDRLAQFGGFGGFGGSGSSSIGGVGVMLGEQVDCDERPYNPDEAQKCASIRCPLTSKNVPRLGGTPTDASGGSQALLQGAAERSKDPTSAISQAQSASAAGRKGKGTGVVQLGPGDPVDYKDEEAKAWSDQVFVKKWGKPAEQPVPMPKVAGAPVTSYLLIPVWGCEKLKDLQRGLDADGGLLAVQSKRVKEAKNAGDSVKLARERIKLDKIQYRINYSGFEKGEVFDLYRIDKNERERVKNYSFDYSEEGESAAAGDKDSQVQGDEGETAN
ncbi:MAG: hypothetical protein IIA00_04055 [Proteobacteria bacterium]|nr:hypothetical protein [Pseudomonadota bacterium]